MLSFLVKSQEKKNGRCAPRLLDPSFGPVITSAIRLGDDLDSNGEQGRRGFYVEDGGNPYLMSWGLGVGRYLGASWRAAFISAKDIFNIILGLITMPTSIRKSRTCSAIVRLRSASLPILTMGRDFANGNLWLDEQDHLECDWTIKKSQEYYDRVLKIGRGIAQGAARRVHGKPPVRVFQAGYDGPPARRLPDGTRRGYGGRRFVRRGFWPPWALRSRRLDNAGAGRPESFDDDRRSFRPARRSILSINTRSNKLIME